MGVTPSPEGEGLWDRGPFLKGRAVGSRIDSWVGAFHGKIFGGVWASRVRAPHLNVGRPFAPAICPPVSSIAH